ncbi:MAG TPA: sensor domain-containing diguanylate cyclase, partial [Candidatus Limnocylindrales bacterium]
MAGSQSPEPRQPDPQDRRLARAGWILGGSFAILGLAVLLGLALGPVRPIDAAVAVLVAVAGSAAWLHARAAAGVEVRRGSEADGFARILRGLSRSVSPDAIVEAIVEELGVASGADHVVVVRLRPNTGLLEATLVTTRAGVPPSTTVLPLSDLEDPLDEGAPTVPVPVAVGPGPVRTGRTGPGPGGGGRSGPEPAGSGRSGPGPGGAGRPAVDSDRTVALAEPGPLPDAIPLSQAPIGGAEGPRPRSDPDRLAARLAARVRSVYGLKHTIAAPLASGSGVVGAIVLSRRTSDPWPDSSARLLRAAAVEASSALQRAYSHRAAETRAATDALTGLPNRRYFDEYLALFSGRRRAGDAVGILMIDIDRFKRLNDQFGHAVGDRVLRAVAGAIASAVREDDVPARYGGEEFVVLLRNPGHDVAVDVGERVREAVRRLDCPALGVSEVSVSVGVAVGDTPEQPVSELIERADR